MRAGVVLADVLAHHAAPNVSFLQFVQMRQQRLRVLRPEHDEPAFLKRHETFHTVEWIGPSGITNLQPVEKPIGIECRNVRAAARRKYPFISS